VSTRRRRQTRATVGIAMVAAAGLLLAACTTSDSDTGGTKPAVLPKTLVFSPLSLAPPALKGLSEGVKAYAGSKGWEVIVQDPNFDAAKQTQQLNEVLDSGRAGAAWVIAVAPQAMGDTLKAAQAKGIPILVNGRPDEYGYSGPQPGITFDYIDYTAAGTALGEQMGKCINAKLGGNAAVLYGTGAAGSAGKNEIDAAAKAALLKTAPNAKIVSTIIVTDRAQSQTDIGNALQGNPNIAGVMATNDEGTLGALGAYDAAGKALPCAIDFGGNDEVLGDVKSGKIYASVALQFQADMTQSFDTLVKMQSNPKANGDVLVVPAKVVTAAG
jgi:ABC-type sugar transport system substrate-binding protein